MLEGGEEEKVEEEEGPEDEEGRGVDPGDEEDRVEGGAEGGVKGNCIKLILLVILLKYIKKVHDILSFRYLIYSIIPKEESK